MDTKFMIHRDSKTSDPRRLLLSFPDKINLTYTIHTKI